MLVGNGLVANALVSYKNNDHVIIFASGVSNSLACDVEQFRREEELISKYFISDALFIYFSTCSIYDPSLSKSAYVLHKLRMEQLIERNFKKYLIIRLPTLVGKTDNPHTFFNSFVNKLKASAPITVYKNASRYLLDVDDLPVIVNLLEQNVINTKINVVFDNKMPVTEIVNYLHHKLSSKSQIIYENKGTDFTVDNSKFKKLYTDMMPEIKIISFENLVNKYIFISSNKLSL